VLDAPELAPVAALAIGRSNHLLLFTLPPGTQLPVAIPDRPYDRRIDRRWFDVGPFSIVFGERYGDPPEWWSRAWKHG
jgi:hypothetical protein